MGGFPAVWGYPNEAFEKKKKWRIRGYAHDLGPLMSCSARLARATLWIQRNPTEFVCKLQVDMWESGKKHMDLNWQERGKQILLCQLYCDYGGQFQPLFGYLLQ